MDLLAMLQGLMAQLQDAAVALEAAKKASYDEGFAAGVASMGAGDKIYTQAELDAKIQEATLPLQEKIASLEAMLAGVDAKIADAVAAAKQEIMAKLQEIDAMEDAKIAEIFA